MKMKIMGMDFLNTKPTTLDFVKRLQALIVASYLLVYFHYLSVVGVLTFFGFLFSPLFFLALGYAYWYMKTTDVPLRGGYNFQFLKNLSIWEYFRGYFPVNLFKTQDLDSNKNYIFAMHPHGLLNVGGMSFFATLSKEFQFKFPGLTPHMLVDRFLFMFPMTREILLFFGLSARDRTNMEYILSNKGSWTRKGQVCCVVLGEKEEVFRQEPGKITLIVKSRKEFVRAALRTGASIVPVFSFGEDTLYNVRKTPQTLTQRMYEIVKSLYKIFFMLTSTFGLFRFSFGFMPMRKRIDVVVGKPIDVTKEDHPTEDQANKLFEVYLRELESLFNEQKKYYLEDKNAVLSFE